MRNLQLLVILVLVLFAASLIQKEGLGSKQTQKKNIMVPTPTPTPIPIPTSIPSTSTPTPFFQINMSSFIYPGSTILNQSEDKMTLQSSDDPQAITNWYKEKITSMGMNAKSFVQTNTNGNILNKLAGANGSINVSIEISKQNSESKTVIKILIK
ncbi:MAG: hypothetical protein A3B44_02435 [Candidatus Levybacteria bacterium RIFCSPLOWO2_01_FULL_38_21]|nr:MAG: hypothetical protein A3B44_02435 [Candidatus Levybacteria bacterium RIFCSPLOWO2_01_FULL_38_21]